MSEGLVTRLSLLCSLTGLAVIYAAANSKQAVTPIASLSEDFVGTRVTVSGRIVDLREHIDGHLFLKLRDDSGGVISVPIFASMRSQLKETPELLDVVQVTGSVKKYRDELEVIPRRAGDMRIVHIPPAKISSLTRELVGELIKVEGVIAERAIVGKGSLIFTLRDDGGQLPVFVPASVVKDGFPEVHIGYAVRVGGLLQLYNDNLELQLGNASNIRVIEAA